MRYINTVNNFGMIVSNDEYDLIKKIKAHGKYPVNKLSEFYIELGDRLCSKGGVIDKVEEGDEEFFVYLKRKNK